MNPIITQQPEDGWTLQASYARRSWQRGNVGEKSCSHTWKIWWNRQTLVIAGKKWLMLSKPWVRKLHFQQLDLPSLGQ